MRNVKVSIYFVCRQSDCVLYFLSEVMTVSQIFDIFRPLSLTTVQKFFRSLIDSFQTA